MPAWCCSIAGAYLVCSSLGYRFVSALEVPSCAPSILISGGGDPDLYIWEFRLGRIIGRIPIWDHIRPFIRVKGERRRFKEAEKKASKSKKNKSKNIDAVETLDQGDTPMDTSVDNAESADEEVLVISQITYVQFGGVGVVLFSAVGWVVCILVVYGIY